jgi:hypothetical protein
MGIRQKSAVHFGGVLMLWLVIFGICSLGKRTVEQLLSSTVEKFVATSVLAGHDGGLPRTKLSAIYQVLQLLVLSYE